MTYTPKDYAKLLGMAGFSETLLKNHFTLYQGYVTNTNKLLDTLAAMLKDGKVTAHPPPSTPSSSGGWAGSSTACGCTSSTSRTSAARSASRHSGRSSRRSSPRPSAAPTDWEKDFRATGTMRGIGWVVLYQERRRPPGQLLGQRARRRRTPPAAPRSS